MVTNATTMVATTFHNRLRQCLGREIDLCAHRRGAAMDRKARGAWLRVALRRAVDPSDATPWPEVDARPELQTALGARRSKRHDRCGTALPCKSPQQVQKPHVPVPVGWLYEMRAHLDKRLAAVPEEDRSRAFARGGLKTFGRLPLATPRAKHVQASPTALYYLLAPAYGKSEGGERRPNGLTKQDVTSAPDAFFRREFPGLATYERNAGGAAFRGSFRKMRTASPRRSCSAGHRRTMRPRRRRPFDPDAGSSRSSEGTDLQSAYPPAAPQDGQRTVGIDPGRRDMLVGVVYYPTSRAPCDAARVIKMSTRRYVRKSGRVGLERALVEIRQQREPPSDRREGCGPRAGGGVPEEEVAHSHQQHRLEPAEVLVPPAHPQAAERALHALGGRGSIFEARINNEPTMPTTSSPTSSSTRIAFACGLIGILIALMAVAYAFRTQEASEPEPEPEPEPESDGKSEAEIIARAEAEAEAKYVAKAKVEAAEAAARRAEEAREAAEAEAANAKREAQAAKAEAEAIVAAAAAVEEEAKVSARAELAKRRGGRSRRSSSTFVIL